MGLGPLTNIRTKKARAVGTGLGYSELQFVALVFLFKKGIDGRCGRFAVAHGQDDRGAATHDVAAGKHAG